MQTAVNLIIETGIKKTSLRIQVLETLMSTKRSFSFNELYQYFNKQQNRSTFYRMLQCFEQKNIVQKIIDSDGIVRYFFREINGIIEPLFRCDNCGKVIHVTAIPDAYIDKLEGLEIKCAMIQAPGLCKDCKCEMSISDS